MQPEIFQVPNTNQPNMFVLKKGTKQFMKASWVCTV
ncbi:hypothetical protein ACOMHN_065284 [Nucella lapillus]